MTPTSQPHRKPNGTQDNRAKDPGNQGNKGRPQTYRNWDNANQQNPRGYYRNEQDSQSVLGSRGGQRERGGRIGQGRQFQPYHQQYHYRKW